MTAPPPKPTTSIDPRFVFDFTPLDEPTASATDSGRRWSTYWDVERLCRGPEPLPPWVVTDRAAVDTDLGVLKTGKEADVFVVERRVGSDPDRTALMAAKRYRSEEHRTFHRSSTYTEGRRTRNSRDTRAMAKRTTHGRAVAAGQWAWAEWEAMKRLWSAGVPVPYPVQIDGTEIPMELVTGDRLVIIDLPQLVDVVGNPSGPDFLMRDCHHVCTWFRARGLEVDEHVTRAEGRTPVRLGSGG